MKTVTIRELRNHGKDVIDRVLGGERLLVTRSGRPVAELRPVRRRGLSTQELLERSRALPRVDVRRFREDLDSVLDATV